jgi:aldehyde:ferredoxin oxidoreductase
VAYPREGFAQALKDLYGLKGWQAGTTIPSPERLKKLKIEWARQTIQGG